MTKEELKKLKKQQEELSGNKMLLIFGAATVSLFALTILRNRGWFYASVPAGAEKIILLLLMALSCAGLVGGILWFCLARARGKAPEMKLINGMNLAITALAMLICSLMLYFFTLFGARMSYIVITLSCALALVYHIFRREFFVVSAILGISGTAFYFFFRLPTTILQFENPWKVLAAIFAVILAGFAVFMIALFHGDGELRIGKRTKRLLSEKFRFVPSLIALAYAVLAFAACLIFGYSYFFYCMLGAAALLLGFGVYYILLLVQ